MNGIKLSRDADYLICTIYKRYLEDRKAGKSRTDAKELGGAEELHKTLMPEWQFEDVNDTCWELDRAGLIKCFKADDIAYFAFLEDAGIVYMEGRFQGKVDQVLDYLVKIKSLISL